MKTILEFPFLQIVSKYLNKRCDVFDFMKINKKCKECILSLKTNSFIIYPNELNLFPEIETLNVYNDLHSYSIYIDCDDENDENENKLMKNLKYFEFKFQNKIENIIKYNYKRIKKIEKNGKISKTHNQITYYYEPNKLDTYFDSSDYENLKSLSIDLEFSNDGYLSELECNLNFNFNNLEILLIRIHVYSTTKFKKCININSNSLKYLYINVHDEKIFVNLNTPNLKILTSIYSNINLLNSDNLLLLRYILSKEYSFNFNGNKNFKEIDLNNYESEMIENELLADEIFMKYYNHYLFIY